MYRRSGGKRIVGRSPWGAVGPGFQCGSGPGGGFIDVANVAGVRDFQGLTQFRCDEAERVAADVNIGERLSDFGHVAGDTFAAGTSGFVVSVFFDGFGARAVGRIGSVAIQAQFICRFAEQSGVAGAVCIVTREAGNAVCVHQAGDKVIALHAVFVRGAVGKMCEGGFAEFVIFELPEVSQLQSYVVTDRPIVVFPGDGIGQGASLRMALDAGIVRLNVIEPRGVDDICARGMFDVFAAGAVTFFAADIPLGDVFGRNIVVDGMAAVAG